MQAATPKPEAAAGVTVVGGNNNSNVTPSTPTTTAVAGAAVSVAGQDKTTPVASVTAGSVTVTPAGGTVPTIAGGTSSTTPSGSTPVVKKPHVLNPSAKPFTPRGPSTPNPSRPHTPQTPVPMQTIYTTTNAHMPATNQQIYVVPPHAFQPPTHPGGQATRMRRSNYGEYISLSLSLFTTQIVDGIFIISIYSYEF